jgi:hypothetical protein
MLSMSPADSELDDWSDVDTDEEEVEESPSIDFSVTIRDGDEDEDTDEDEDEDESEQDDATIAEDNCEHISGEEVDGFTKEDYAAFRRYPAILRVNRQIYDEASSLIYTEGVLVVEPADVFALAKKPHALEFGVPAYDIWRHHPLRDPGVVQQNGEVKYNTQPAEEGKMYPHVFARFQKIYFDANFDFEHTQNVELWIDDSTHIIRKEDGDVFQQTLRESTIMKDFVKLLSQSPVINSLEIVLEVEVMTNSNLMMEEVDEQDDHFEETEDKIDRLMDVSNERATELFLDSGVCETLLELDNVQKFNLKIGFQDRNEEEEEKYELLPRHEHMLKEMKIAVEGNFKNDLGLS